MKLKSQLHGIAYLSAALLLAIAMSIFTCQQALAQATQRTGTTRNVSSPLVPSTHDLSQGVKVPANFKFGRMLQHSPFQQSASGSTTNAKSVAKVPTPLKVPGRSVFYANAVSDSYMGLMSYTMTSPINFQTYTNFDKSIFNGGSTIKDGKLCGLYLDTSMESYGIIFIWYGWFDLQTGEYDGDLNTLHDTRLVALANATDPNTGEVFGEFYDASMQGHEFGYVDYDKQTRTKIADAKNLYVAMGITSDGAAYGITDGGDLYEIDRTNGEEIYIGSTGVNPTSSDGMYYNQGGVIDPKTDTFYWASTDGNMDCALYSVDLDNGKATKIEDSPYQQVALNVLPPAAEDKAPGAVSNLALNFEGPSTSGTVTFTMPTKTFDTDTQLTGSIGYQVSVNGKVAKTGTANPGANVSVSLTNIQEGVTQFSVVATNDVGNSPAQTISKYIGYDQPLPPTNVQLAAVGNTATLTWDAPTGSVHDGYMSDITYNVYRVQGSRQTLVRDGLTDRTTTFDIDRDGTLQNYSYTVEAVNHGVASERTKSNGVVAGEALDVPFFDDFNSNIDLYTVIDNNHDGSTWTWEDYRQAARYNYSEDNQGDDWLISPPINLKGGRNYVVSFKASGASERFAERFEAKWGQAPTVAGMNLQLVPSTRLNSSEYSTYEQTVTPTSDGVYYFGIHATSPRGSFYLYIDSLSVREGADPLSPAAVTDLKATPDQTGELSVTLTFNLPTLAVNGSQLKDITKVEVLKGEKNVIWTSDGTLTPGQAMTVVDNNAVEGNNSYTVVAYNSAGKGLSTDASAVAGLDYPNAPEATAVDQQTSVKLTWGDITGVNGGVINQNDVAIWIYSMKDENTIDARIGAVAGKKEYTINGTSTDEGRQQYNWWSLRAYNMKGSSPSLSKTKLLVGEPYSLPYAQSFSNGSAGDKFIDFDKTSKNLTFDYVTNTAVDFDGGAIGISSSEAAKGDIILGKVKLPEGQPTVMSFAYKTATPVPVTLSVVAKLPDGTETEPLWTTDLSSSNSDAWKTASIVIPSSVAENRYIIPTLKADVTSPMASSQVVLIDRVQIQKPLQNDAAVDLNVPASVNKGQTVPVHVTVTNEGINDLTNATVTLKVDGKTIDERIVNSKLATMQSTSYTVDYKTSSLNDNSKLNIEASVTLTGDNNTENNSASASVSLQDAQVETPSNLSAKGNNPVHLNWTAPEGTSQETITDDFENYPAWAIDNFGDWKTVKVDNGVAAGITSQVTLPGQGTSYAFINWQPSDYFRTGQGLDPHSGLRCPAAFYQLTSDQTDVVDNDAWLISPRLSGKAQTISFWVDNLSDQTGTYGKENYEVYYSTSGTDTKDFIKIGETREQSSTEWTEVSIDLPEGARYFAVRHCTPAQSALCFMLDDATYERNVGADSYNIYRNGELIANVIGTSYDDNDNTSEGDIYQVTAVYPDGSESAPISTTVTGIKSVVLSGASKFDVYTVDGKLVRKDAKQLGGLKPGVYIINGQKIILRK